MIWFLVQYSHRTAAPYVILHYLDVPLYSHAETNVKFLSSRMASPSGVCDSSLKCPPHDSVLSKASLANNSPSSKKSATLKCFCQRLVK